MQPGTTRRRLIAATAAAAALPAPLAARAETAYPARPIRVVVPFPPGGPTDVVGRIVAQGLSEAFGGRAVVVENRAGAASVIGTEAVVRAPADGYTLLFGSNSTFAVNAALMPNLPYVVDRDLDLLALVAEGPQVLVVRGGLAAQTVPELIALAKARPGALTFASTGPGGIIHVAGELFRHHAGIDLLHVPYRGGGPAVTALISGEVDMMVNDLSPMLPVIREGRLRALAVAGTARAPQLPEVPTFAELGLPAVVSASWFGLAAPDGLPAPVRARLATALSALLSDAGYRRRLEGVGLDLPGVQPAATPSFIRSETGKWAALARDARIRVE
jgi:tripartite-type tricarboxylate transporter receptor subunit TctC